MPDPFVLIAGANATFDAAARRTLAWAGVVIRSADVVLNDPSTVGPAAAVLVDRASLRDQARPLVLALRLRSGRIIVLDDDPDATTIVRLTRAGADFYVPKARLVDTVTATMDREEDVDLPGLDARFVRRLALDALRDVARGPLVRRGALSDRLLEQVADTPDAGLHPARPGSSLDVGYHSLLARAQPGLEQRLVDAVMGGAPAEPEARLWEDTLLAPADTGREWRARTQISERPRLPLRIRNWWKPRPPGGLEGGGAEVAVPQDAPASPGSDARPSEPTALPLFWNTRFPEHPDVLASEPHVLAAGDDYLLETRLEVMATSDGASRAQDASRLVGRTVRFRLEVLEGERGSDVGLRLWRPGEGDGAVFALSPELTCTEAGTPPFQVHVRAERPGPARLRALLLVDGGSVDQFILDLAVQARTGAPPSGPPPVGAAVERPSGRAVVHAAGPDFLLVLGSTGLQFLHRNTLLAVDAFPVDLREQLGELARARGPGLQALSQRAAPNPQVGHPFRLQLSDESLLGLAKIGAELHHRLFRRPIMPSWVPKSFRDRLGAVADCLQVEGSSEHPALFQILSDLPVPWGLLYDRSANGGQDLRSAGDVEPDGFWGRRFDIFRSVESVDREPYRGRRRWVTPVVGAAVPRHQDHRQVIEAIRLRQGDDQLRVGDTLTTKKDLFGWTSAGHDIDLLYLFCHTVPAGLPAPGQKPAPDSWLGFGASDQDQDRVGLRQLAQRWRKPRPTNPIVILNACGSGQEQPVFGSPFRDFFVTSWRAQIFIGTDWPVNAVFADKFGEALLDALLVDRVSVRNALRRIGDDAARDNNFFSLMYAVYGDSAVRFEEPVAGPGGGPQAQSA